jgi:hypothetical protein
MRHAIIQRPIQHTQKYVIRAGRLKGTKGYHSTLDLFSIDYGFQQLFAF